MPRLTPPTRNTFALSLLAIAIGVVLQLDLVDVAVIDDVEEHAFWFAAGGGAFMALGVLFKRI